MRFVEEDGKERKELLSQVFILQSDIKSITVQCVILLTHSHDRFNLHICLKELWDTQSYF